MVRRSFFLSVYLITNEAKTSLNNYTPIIFNLILHLESASNKVPIVLSFVVIIENTLLCF